MKKSFAWHNSLKGVSHISLSLINIGRLIRGRLNPNVIKSTFILITSLSKIRKCGGNVFLGKYLKACSAYVYKYIAGDRISGSCMYSINVSLTRSGIPRILPKYFRDLLRKKSTWGCRYILTILNLYRVIPFDGKLSFSTITTPWSGKFYRGMESFIPRFWKMLNFKHEFKWEFKPFPISTKGSEVGRFSIDEKGKGNSLTGLISSFVKLRSSCLWSDVKWFFSLSSETEKLEALEELVSSIIDREFTDGQEIPAIGKLALKYEPGKVRVFALVDPITQWVLRPLHDHLYKILRYINKRWSCDATFNQDKGVERVLNVIINDSDLMFSYDLSAATDRLTIEIQKKLLNYIVPTLGDHWGSLLINRSYSIKYHKLIENKIFKGNKEFTEELRYGCGQPMGALSSWGMLAITHHFIVQFAAYISGIREWFSGYVVLGDDIVIFNKIIAKNYLKIMKSLGVSINISKSLISNTHAEFAKRVISAKGLVSGLSLNEFANLHTSWANSLELVRKEQCNLVPYLRLLGLQSFSAGNLPSTGSTFKRILYLSWKYSKFGPDYLFKGCEMNLSYYVHGPIQAYLEACRLRKIASTGIDWFYSREKFFKDLVLKSRPQQALQIDRLLSFWITMNNPDYENNQSLIESLREPFLICFYKSPLYNFLVWGSTSADERVEKYFRNPLDLYGKPSEILLFLKDNPENWYATDLFPDSVTHVFDYKSKDLDTEILLRRWEDLGKILVFYLNIEADLKLKYTQRLISEHEPLDIFGTWSNDFSYTGWFNSRTN